MDAHKAAGSVLADPVLLDPTPARVQQERDASAFRDNAVLAALAAGHGPSEIAHTTGLSRSFVRTIVERDVR